MSHGIETCAYTNEVPWHGLGTYVENAPTTAEMIKLAGLDWTVSLREMRLENGLVVPDYQALTRDSDDTVLDVVGSAYKPTQISEIFSFLNEFVEAGGATMETAGSIHNGKFVWGLVKLNESFKMDKQDEVRGYLLALIPFRRGVSLKFKMTNVRTVCQNTIAMALASSGAQYSMNHRLVFDDKIIKEAKETIGIARDQFGEFERNARLLQKLNISREDSIRLLAPIYQPNKTPEVILNDFEKEGSRTMKRLVNEILVDAPGADPGTGWGLLNAVTYYADHEASRSVDNRLDSAWLGDGANKKIKVFEKLLEMAD